MKIVKIVKNTFNEISEANGSGGGDKEGLKRGYGEIEVALSPVIPEFAHQDAVPKK